MGVIVATCYPHRALGAQKGLGGIPREGVHMRKGVSSFSTMEMIRRYNWALNALPALSGMTSHPSDGTRPTYRLTKSHEEVCHPSGSSTVSEKSSIASMLLQELLTVANRTQESILHLIMTEKPDSSRSTLWTNGRRKDPLPKSN